LLNECLFDVQRLAVYSIHRHGEEDTQTSQALCFLMKFKKRGRKEGSREEISLQLVNLQTNNAYML